jgi:hypothetical protein
MNKYTKLIITVCAMALISTSAVAADVVRSSSNANVTVKNSSFYNAGEFGLSVGTAYTVDRADLFNAPYTANLNAGAFWFPFRNLGVEVNVPVYQTKGVSFSEVQYGVVVRVPLSKTTPILKNLSPYVGFGGVYDWQATDEFAYIAKVGTEVRFNNKWGVFVEGQSRNSEFNWGTSQTSVAGGLRFAF